MLPLCLLAMAVVVGITHAADWPTYMHDNQRSGVSPEALRLPLRQAWSYRSPSPPVPAWTGPAKWDAYAGLKGLRSMRDFDPAFFVTAAGDQVYFGSSLDDAVHCLEARTGEERWVFITEGPVRVAPTWHEGKVYAGSDDGRVYCLDANDGSLVWKHKPSPSDRLIPNNGKLISPWPVRTGVLVADGLAYFGASLLPWEESYLCAVSAQTGEPEGEGCFTVTCTNVTLQGALLASREHLYAMQGRSIPLVFRRSDGDGPQPVRGPGGGVYGLLSEDGGLIHGHGSKNGWLALSRGEPSEHLASVTGANRMLLAGDMAYLQKGEELSALDRKLYVDTLVQKKRLSDQQAATKKQLDKLPKEKADERSKLEAELRRRQEEAKGVDAKLSQCYRWTVPCPHVHALILAGETLFAGGEGTVVAYRADDGHQGWTAAVEGQAHGLTAAGGRLYVSTDAGAIYCFEGGG